MSRGYTLEVAFDSTDYVVAVASSADLFGPEPLRESSAVTSRSLRSQCRCPEG